MYIRKNADVLMKVDDKDKSIVQNMLISILDFDGRTSERIFVDVETNVVIYEHEGKIHVALF